MFDIKIDKNLIERRKEFLKDVSYTEITLELDDSIYETIEMISKENDISINDYLIHLLQEDIISKVDKPIGIDRVIDSAYLSLYIEDLINSKEKCLIVDIVDLEPKCVLIPEDDYKELKNFSN